MLSLVSLFFIELAFGVLVMTSLVKKRDIAFSFFTLNHAIALCSGVVAIACVLKRYWDEMDMIMNLRVVSCIPLLAHYQLWHVADNVLERLWRDLIQVRC